MHADIFGKLFKWEPKRNALNGIALGFIVILLSIIMIYVREYIIISIIIRDIVMILFFGIGLPFYIISKEHNLKKYGLHLGKWHLFLPINIILSILLFMMFFNESPPQGNFFITSDVIWKIIYIMFAGIFETIIFYSYIRTAVEDSFGIIPAILLAAVFYSLHHAGFQPEFGKLFLVGILYACVFRIGNSVLLIYPFFWGAGACYDVLIQSEVVSDIMYPKIRSIILLIGISLIIEYFTVKKNIRISSVRS